MVMPNGCALDTWFGLGETVWFEKQTEKNLPYEFNDKLKTVFLSYFFSGPQNISVATAPDSHPLNVRIKMHNPHNNPWQWGSWNCTLWTGVEMFAKIYFLWLILTKGGVNKIFLNIHPKKHWKMLNLLISWTEKKSTKVLCYLTPSFQRV